MADVNVVADSTAQPPVNEISVNSLGLFDSIQVSRIQDNVETLIRSQPNKGVSNALAYDYEAKYGIPVQYHVTGLEENTSLASAWLGTANASTSTLSKDGTVIATNNILDPQGKTNHAFWSQGTYVAVQDTDGKWTYSVPAYDTADNSCFITPLSRDWTPPTLEDYVLVACFDDLVGLSLDKINFENNAGTLATGSNWRAVRCALSTSNTVHLAIGIGSGSTDTSTKSYKLVNWGVYSISDWQAMQSLDIDWFDGDTYALGSTSQFDILTDPVTLTPQYGWLIHPANPAKSMQLPRGRITGFTDIGRAANATRHDVMGASLPVYTINGSRHGMEFTLELKTKSFDEESMLWALLTDQVPILIDWLDADAQRLNMTPMFVQVGDVTQARFVQQIYVNSDSSYPDHWRTWQLPCIQVQSPAISQQTAVWTYLGLLNEQSS
ncbi:hypothetical protein, partial [Bifidobacterium aquikefiri]